MEDIDKRNLPRHLAIIMDGNGRWAQAKGMKRIEGHRVGTETVRTITRACRRIGIEYLTLYAFSSENWQRPTFEVEALMSLLSRYLRSELEEMLGNGIRLNTIGESDRLPKAVRNILIETIAKTRENSGMVLTLALSYGGRNEILRACRRIAEDCLAGRTEPDKIDEESIRGYLYSPELPDPDLLIRTGGESRISNFLLWQIAYTEIYVTRVMWPDFSEDVLREALLDYGKRQRRFGLTGDQVAGKGQSQ